MGNKFLTPVLEKYKISLKNDFDAYNNHINPAGKPGIAPTQIINRLGRIRRGKTLVVARRNNDYGRVPRRTLTLAPCSSNFLINSFRRVIVESRLFANFLS